ncbi:cytidine deaminase [Falsiroseomonas selenitidurans]|uniref:Cytidine deaminase n=1 Tax=Falsiroseomonas selenitidurans TaxID=2716335 RepID=A0ABX1EEC0_9PROT|nr:cytidine deaminase [Falsiroseomonas selenitidurans]NKC34073.1 cytidine deaminase [Falsiroseomonas selenitidurans]
MQHVALMAAAEAARAHAHAPYSRFAVGAALLCADGTVQPGCNVENASYGATLCAERVALGAAVAAGQRRFTAIAVAGPAGVALSPCGICRQVLAEFSPDGGLLVLMRAADGTPRQARLADLLPDSFGPDQLRTD